VAITTDTTYSNAFRADNLGDVKPSILIGGKTEKFVPNVNISFALESSKEQFFLNINRASVTVDKETSSLASEKLALTIGNETDIWHIDENGHLKWDIKFAQKPPTNKLSWALTHSEGLEFAHQPALTQAEIDRGSVRPDNVVGSYAVYCNKTGHLKDADGKTIVNYGPGKLLHIYRPLCIDAEGKKEWAELLIEKGTLNITIPQKFVDNAVYPMTLDPNLGLQTVGGSVDNFTANYTWAGNIGSMSENGTLTDIYAYQGYGNASNEVRLGVWGDSSGQPGELVGNTGIITPPGDESWIHDSASGSLTSGVTYYAGWIHEGSNPARYWDTVSGYTQSTNSTTTFSTLPNPFNRGSTASNCRFSIYLVYTAAGGASPVPLFDYYFNNMRP
jgi:hypothetical protein